MEKKKITRVISKAKSNQIKLEKPASDLIVEEKQVDDKDEIKTKKGCSFCQRKTKPAYTDISTLRRFLTERSKIVSKMRSGVCSKHQRAVSRNVKYARHLALLPFVPKI